MIGALLFFNGRGDLILGRFYKPDVPHIAVEAFRHQVLLPKEFSTPVVVCAKYRNSVYILCA
jgi:hypothetical protein